MKNHHHGGRFGQRYHHQGGRHGHGRGHHHGGRSDNNLPRAFTKLVRDPTASVRNSFDARKFVADMAKFEKKEDLLAQLTDNRFLGLSRIRDVLSYIETVQDLEQILIGMLDSVMVEETSRPIYRTVRNKVLLSIYLVPGLLDTLIEQGFAPALSVVSAAKLTLFLLEVAKANIEARKSDAVRTLAKALRDRGDLAGSDVKALCSLILADVDRPDLDADGGRSNNPAPRVVSWVTDEVPPGGRHDNDNVNYRNIELVPTVEELKCEARPYLPLASGDNAFLQDPESHLLDRNFRLLRHDAICAMKDAIQTQHRPWLNARLVGIDLESMKYTRTVSFVIQCDSRFSDGRDIARTRALMVGSVIALCDPEGTPMRLATITVREDTWLKNPTGPRFGVVFQSSEDFEESLLEYVSNRGIIQEIKSPDGDDDRQEKKRIRDLSDRLIRYTLIEASNSFFAYRPVLQSLQSMHTVPLAEELVLMRASGQPPDYLPNELHLPRDPCFSSYRCNFGDGWDPDDTTKKTSLDRSQADALHHAFTSRVAAIQGPPGTGKVSPKSLLCILSALKARTILVPHRWGVVSFCLDIHRCTHCPHDIAEHRRNDTVCLLHKSCS
jgi:hypothetical protein